MKVKYKNMVNFEGRNGFFKQSGIEVMGPNPDGIISLFPITSRGDIARCMVEIPAESLNEFINALQVQANGEKR